MRGINWSLLALSFCATPLARGQQTNALPAAPAVVLPRSVPDPIEPVNRAIWDFNKGLMTGVIKPTAEAYRFVIRKPVRTGLANMWRNLNYPDRLINNLLQGKWTGARDETYRFLYNSTVGVAGFFDPATRIKIPKADADFGQTFGQWGWKPQCFLMLPFYGPSNERDTVGLGADTASNPLLYISPYDFVADDPLTWLGPYSYFTYAVMYNDLSDSVNEYVRFSQAEMDPYSEIQYAWTFARENKVANFQVKGKQDPASLETLESVFFTYKDPDFPNYAKTRSVLIPSTGRRLKFTFWLQPGIAPVVYIVPGLGSHRMAETSIALAELAFRNGFTAVTVSSPFNSEFMASASTADLPAYLPVDGHDMHVALTEIDRRLSAEYPHRFSGRALLGYSMGAIESLYIASTEAKEHSSLMAFDRYVAINTPVQLLHGVSMLDQFYGAPLAWPEAERTDDLENTFLKVAALSKGTLSPRTTLPFSAVESKFLIGLTFRYILRDVIYSSQRRENLRVLHHPISTWRRESLYDEIMRYSYRDYFEKFVVPHYNAQGLTVPTVQELGNAGDLRTYETSLRANKKIRVIANENDFLLSPADLTWLHATFSPAQLTVFPEGGHLGNLRNIDVQKTIVGMLGDLNKPIHN